MNNMFEVVIDMEVLEEYLAGNAEVNDVSAEKNVFSQTAIVDIE